MKDQRGLVLDANILVRAVFGKRVRRILESANQSSIFCSPDRCFEEALRHIPAIATRRLLDAGTALNDFENISRMVEPIGETDYADFRESAMHRISERDADDWPVVAVALMLQFPIWTEDQDFFGIGIGTWTTDRVELYLRQ